MSSFAEEQEEKLSLQALVKTNRQKDDEPAYIGRIVHFIDGEGKNRAAMIVGVDKENVVDLITFTVYGTFCYSKVKFDEDRNCRTWHLTGRGK